MKANKKSSHSHAPECILHGEAMIFQSKLPAGAKKFVSKNEKYLIIADSETTGNHHVVDVKEKVEFYMDENGTMFMVNEEPTDVRCLHPDRHDAVTIQPGCWEFGVQQEYDHFAQHLKNVRD